MFEELPLVSWVIVCDLIGGGPGIINAGLTAMHVISRGRISDAISFPFTVLTSLRIPSLEEREVGKK